ncbi:hypothetical protein Desor_4058 [Desulfosporosinus orientis DSM 765]|uniref:Uncharacterized protein n=1 Tax=Desulfosporosinus orientis (strain ATCC 19365 / DSM 765 / NCIMB 8382 / VKM B-1628 / Singapore I) TaxID=768706 RepID=G7WFY5_DESOD|nr:hypothetical protein [Desulfosporosinus orientis]AET69500.1 hypothetical protein Desor_4058 [Desulfosporosinus orientis DSM 765]
MAEQKAKIQEAVIDQPKSTETMNSAQNNKNDFNLKTRTRIKKVMDAFNLCCNCETGFHYIEQ